MPRFFVSKNEIHDSFMVLTGENAAHAKVLRLKNGDEVTVCDGEGSDYRCTVSDTAPGQISLVVHASSAARSEASISCSIYMAFAKSDKFEHVIQKSIELGVHKIVPVSTRRTVVKLDGKKKDKKLDRYRKIAESAAAQSKRAYIPEVGDLVGLDQVDASKLLVAYEEEGQGLKESLKSSDGEEISILIGPEGGLDPQEVTLLESKGARLVNFGKRRLRTETAGPFLISAIQYELGDMG